jgi:hypothetical protein
MRHIVQYDNGIVTISIGQTDVNRLAIIVTDAGEQAWIANAEGGFERARREVL